MSAFAICVVAVFYVARVSGAGTSGFLSLEQLGNDDGRTRQLVGLDVRQWLFPAIRFTCDGYVTKWIFRATNETTGGIDDSVLPPFLPLMETFEELTEATIGPSIEYRLKSTTGSEQELQGSGPVYEYVLQSPVEVQEDDTFGIRTLFPGQTEGAWRLRLEMLEVAPGTAPTSFPKAFSADVFDTDFNIIPTNNNLIPLVTAVISIPRGGGTTSLVFPRPTPTPTPGIQQPVPRPSSLSRFPSSTQVVSNLPGTISNSVFNPSIPPMTSTQTSLPLLPTQTLVPTQEDSTSDSVSLVAVAGGAAGGLLVSVLLITVVTAVFCVVVRKRTKTRNINIHEPHQPGSSTLTKEPISLELSENIAYVSNEAYGTTRTGAIPTVSNEAYGTAQREFEMSGNVSYVETTTEAIPLAPNEAYTAVHDQFTESFTQELLIYDEPRN